MKRRTIPFSCGLCFVLAVLCAGSCGKDAPEPDGAGESHAVRFRFREFRTDVKPLGTLKPKNGPIAKLAAANPPQIQNPQEGYLYYWSFNGNSLAPDIQVSAGAKITYNGGNVPDNFASGWAYDTYIAGRALSLTGVQELVFEIPLSRVLQIQSLGFDIGSSGTGPKSFDLLYSQDGESYAGIIADNQFANTNAAQARNAFVGSVALPLVTVRQRVP